MAAEYMTWWPLSAWISPGAVAWFLFLNVLVGAIAVTSRAQQGGGRAELSCRRRRLCRSASSMVLDRLWSLFMFSNHPTEELCWYNWSPEADKVQVREAWVPEPAVKEPVATAPPNALVAAAADAGSAASASGSAEDDTEAEEKPVNSDETDAPDRNSHAQESLPPPPPAAAPVVAAASEATSEVQRPRCRNERPATVADFAKPKRRAHVYAEVEGKAKLNARAEQFIRQFRQELKLQRLNSILSHAHALASGAGASSTSR